MIPLKATLIVLGFLCAVCGIFLFALFTASREPRPRGLGVLWCGMIIFCFCFWAVLVRAGFAVAEALR